MSKKIKNRIKAQSQRTYLAKDFESLRQDLIRHAKVFFPDKIRDFSEPSLAGLLVDVAASVGDTMSFYLDHQFRELDPFTAVEFSNIENHIRNSGLKIPGASPASTEVEFTLICPAELSSDGIYQPKFSALPTILSTTRCESQNGVRFIPVHDLDFSEKDLNGNYVANYTTSKTEGGVPTQYKVTRSVVVVSGDEAIDTFPLSNAHVPFRQITLGNTDVSDIISVTDTEGNEYYEVDSLSQDTVFVPVDNTNRDDFDLVPKTLEIISAPRRFVTRTSSATRTTTLRFGSGNAAALDDDIVPDPSDLAIKLFGKKSFPRFSIDPQSLIDTQTLGMSPRGTTITVRYRFGGGLKHNVDVGTIIQIPTLSLEFRNSPDAEDALFVRQNITVNNPVAGSGGANTPTLDFLRSMIIPARNSQQRIVTREDLLARVYTLPAEFGRVFRIGLSDNPENPLALQMHIICLDRIGQLAVAPDSLKDNLSTYLNEFRLISDAIDVLDSPVVNFHVTYEVFVDKKSNKQSVLQNINRRIADSMNRRLIQIDQPIIIDDIVNIIINTPNVISLVDLQIGERVGVIEDREYSNFTFPFEESIKNGILRGPIGSIFELKFPEKDITGFAI